MLKSVSAFRDVFRPSVTPPRRSTEAHTSIGELSQQSAHEDDEAQQCQKPFLCREGGAPRCPARRARSLVAARPAMEEDTGRTGQPRVTYCQRLQLFCMNPQFHPCSHAGNMMQSLMSDFLSFAQLACCHALLHLTHSLLLRVESSL